MQEQAWTPERVGLLRQLWTAGETAAAIAARLGGMSRSAVLGKIFRLRLAGPGSGEIAQKERSAAAPTQNAGDVQVARRRRRPKRAHQQQQSLNAATRGRTLLELTNNTCRWPHGRPGTAKFHFCGAPEADLERGIPYCTSHMRRAYPMFESALGDRRPPAEQRPGRGR
jgi:GcrA cell cycle regulator